MQNNTNGPKQIRPDLIRRDFPLLEGNPVAYLDNAATTRPGPEAIAAARTDKKAVWAVNTEDDYHEQR